MYVYIYIYIESSWGGFPHGGWASPDRRGRDPSPPLLGLAT